MICPNCRGRRRWYETTCPDCHVDLVERIPGEPEPAPDVDLVAVFRTQDAGMLPLAELALQGERIQYSVRRMSVDARRPYRVGVTDFNNPLDAAEIVVASTDAARATDLLADLEHSGPLPPADAAPPAAGAPIDSGTGAAAPEPARSVHLHDVETGAALGAITSAQLQTLIDLLEEESETSQCYYIDAPTLEMLEAEHAGPALVDLLRRALGSRAGMDIRWSRGGG